MVNKVEYLKERINSEEDNNIDVYDFLLGKDFEDALLISDVAMVSLCEGLTGLCVPSKAYSYMSAGLPILAIMDESDLVLDIESNNIGCSVKNGNIDKICNFLEKMSESKVTCKEMGIRAKKVFNEKYEKNICTKKYVELVRSVISDRD